MDRDFIDIIVKLDIPAIICGLDKPRKKAYRRYTDETNVGKMAAGYFMKKRFRNFAFCGFDDELFKVSDLLLQPCLAWSEV